ncbi:MAG: DUF3783 domain-containing protein [Phascolarctobacterium sp.]|nr:DUF3783 domain-containing protein [Phascolarctobacterium sp.]
MIKQVLAYNFTAERLQALKMVSFIVKAQCKQILREDMQNPIGFAAGLEEFSAGEKYAGDEAADEMIIMCGFNRPDMDRLLSGIRKNKILKNIDLKCVLTPTNAKWSAIELMTELKKEHEYMRANKPGRVHK